jgi:hypothetical protein
MLTATATRLPSAAMAVGPRTACQPPPPLGVAVAAGQAGPVGGLASVGEVGVVGVSLPPLHPVHTSTVRSSTVQISTFLQLPLLGTPPPPPPFPPG